MKDCIIIFVSYMILQIFIIKVFRNFITKAPTIKEYRLIPLILVSSLLNTFLYHLKIPIISSIVNYLYFFLILKISFKINLKDTILYSIYIWIITIILDMTVMLLIQNIEKSIFIKYEDYIKIVSTIILISIMWILSKIAWFRRVSQKFLNSIKVLDYSSIKFIFLIIIYLCFDIVCVYNLEQNNYIFLLLIIAITTLIVVVIIIVQQYSIYTLKITKEYLSKNNQSFVSSINEFRIFKHNLTNKLLGVKSVSNKKSKILIDEIIKEYNSQYIYSNITEIPNGINGLIFEKIHIQNKKDLNIKINNNIKQDLLKTVGARGYNLLSEAIGVCLDNAIEASIKSREKLIYLEFKEDDSNVLIKIINTYTGIIDIDKLGNINYSTKGGGHGIGIYSLIGKRKLKIYTYLKDKLFITEIKVKKIQPKR